MTELNSEFFTVEELAALLKISTRTIIRLISDRKIRASKVGREWRVSRINLEKYLKTTENK